VLLTIAGGKLKNNAVTVGLLITSEELTKFVRVNVEVNSWGLA